VAEGDEALELRELPAGPQGEQVPAGWRTRWPGGFTRAALAEGGTVAPYAGLEIVERLADHLLSAFTQSSMLRASSPRRIAVSKKSTTAGLRMR
jgi:hypothetical protein